MNVIAVVLKQGLFGLTGLLLIGGLAYTESKLSPSQLSTPRVDAESPQSLSPEQLRVLASGVRSGVRIGPSYAVESDQQDGVWYVGVKMYHVPQGEIQTATWLMTGSKSAPGLVFSIDSTAQALSIWPMGQDRVPVSEVDSEVWALMTALHER